MDFLEKLFDPPTSAAGNTVTVSAMVAAAFFSFFLSLVVGYTYRITHQGPSYSQTTVHTMVIMAVVVSLIMLIIGSNIARAFSLVGALSIIRFRNAVKESRDVAFYFLAMAVGMACGTRYIAIACIFILTICPMIYFMARFNVGAKPVAEVLMRLLVGDKCEYQSAFNEIFFKYLENADLISVDSDGTGRLELIYSVTLRKDAHEQALLGELGELDDTQQAQLIHGHNNINL